MKSLIASLVLFTTPVQAHYMHHVKPIVPVDPSSQRFLCWANPAGVFICAVAIGIIVHEIMGPKCAKPGNKNGYDTPTFWRPLCSDPAVVSVRG